MVLKKKLECLNLKYLTDFFRTIFLKKILKFLTYEEITKIRNQVGVKAKNHLSIVVDLLNQIPSETLTLTNSALYGWKKKQ